MITKLLMMTGDDHDDDDDDDDVNFVYIKPGYITTGELLIIYISLSEQIMRTRSPKPLILGGLR